MKCILEKSHVDSPLSHATLMFFDQLKLFFVTKNVNFNMETGNPYHFSNLVLCLLVSKVSSQFSLFREKMTNRKRQVTEINEIFCFLPEITIAKFLAKLYVGKEFLFLLKKLFSNSYYLHARSSIIPTNKTQLKFYNT